LLIVIALLLAGPAVAQTVDPPLAASATLGWGQTWDDEGSLGSGIGTGVRLEGRLFGNTRAEVGVDLLLHDRDAGYFQANGRTAFFTAALIQRFGRAAVQPYLLAGGLIAWHRGDVSFSDQVLRPRRSTDTGLVFGGGMAIRFKQRFEAGPELRLITIAPDNDIDPAWAYLASIRIGYRF
jgi:hypothetical protein